MPAAIGGSLLALAAIVAAARLVGGLAARAGQPRVGGEMVAGLVLGATLLSPGGAVGPSAVRVVDLLGTAGVTLYCLLVGLTLSPAELRRHRRRIAGLGGAMILAALALAPVGAAWFAAERWGLTPGTAMRILVLAAALMVNGFPIVARILEERGALHGDLGCTVLGASALLMVAPFVLVAAAERDFAGPALASLWWGLRLVATVGAGAAVAVAWPRLVGRLPVADWGPGAAAGVAVAAALAAAWVSSRVLGTGLLGGFAVGVGLSRSPAAGAALRRGLGRVVPGLLLPVFLAAAGGRIDPRVLDAGVFEGAAIFGGLLVAVAALAGGAAARARQIAATERRTITALLNCRGVVLLALAVSMVDHHLIGPPLAAAFFLGAVLTTLMTGPLMARVLPAAVPATAPS